jgi:sortase B
MGVIVMKRVSESYKRYKRRKRRLILKVLARFTIPFASLIVAGSFVIHSFKDLGLLNFKDDSSKYIIESTEDKEIPETIESEEVESITETETETVRFEEETEEIEEPTEYIGTELLDMNYDFENIDFDTLSSINPDTIGWIHIDGTNVDYPMVQGEDNEYYSHRDIEGNNSSLGTIYLDSNNLDFSNPTYALDDLNFIYGHHITNGRMFATISNYKKQSFVDEYPFIVIYTKDGYAYKGDVFAGVLFDGVTSNLYNNYENFESQEEFENYMEYINANSMISTDVDVEYGDKIVALVTCSYENGINGNLRFVVFARLSKQYTNPLQIEESANKTLHR